MYRGLLLIATICFVGISSGHADTIRVPRDQPTIQRAINAAKNGDEIVVSNGVWTGPENKNIDLQGKAITVRSKKGPVNCIIDCEGSGRGFEFKNFEESDSVLDGFTIRNGQTEGGAGISCRSSGPTIRDCVIVGNRASDAGGGILLSFGCRATVSDCIINGNIAPRGGGIAAFDDTTPTASISNCVISNNTTTGIGGGGIYMQGSAAHVVGCDIRGNEAINGGGIHCSERAPDYPWIIACTVVSNSSTAFGGGITCRNDSDARIVNCLIAANDAGDCGGGLYVYHAEPRLWSSTLSGNRSKFGGGIYVGRVSDLGVVNCVLWGDRASEAGNEVALGTRVERGGTIGIRHCDVEGGKEGVFIGFGGRLFYFEGNIDSDPEFVNMGNGDYRLSHGSPCIDAGHNEYVPEGIETDLDGKPRFVDDPNTYDTGRGDPPIVDMGAYEFDQIVPCGEGVLLSSDTIPHGGVDSREEHEFGNPDLLTGLDSFVFTFDDSLGVLPVCFEIEETGGGNAPKIFRTEDMGDNRVRVTLDRPITAGEWTTFRYKETTFVDIGFLPGDVNQSRRTTGRDISELIDCLNTPGTCRDHRTDIDRSGQPNGNDISRLIDLLRNIPKDPRPWLNVKLPPQPHT